MPTQPALAALFAPASVALIGATDRPHTVGAVTLANLRAATFGGDLYLVNPKHAVLAGLPVYPNVASLPAVPELAIVATHPQDALAAVAELAARGTKAAVVITAGFAELGADGAALQRGLLAAAREHGMRVLGPNSLGVIVPGIGLNASFAQTMPPPGDVALLSQSGGMLAAMLDWAQPREIGFSHVVSFGNMADIDFGEVVAYLDGDPGTRAFALYVEGIANAPAFMAAVRAAAPRKPVLVFKVGRQPEAAKAARSHTGALSGSAAVYDSAFRRAGMLPVGDMAGVFDGLETLALTAPAPGDRLAILTNGGGPGVVATDALISAGGKLAALGASTLGALDAILPPTWSHANPVDMIGDAPPAHYAAALEALLRDGGVDAVLVLNCPTALADPVEPARAIVGAAAAFAAGHDRKNVYTAWLGEASAAAARREFAHARIPTYETPGDAVRGFMDRVNYYRSQAILAERPPAHANPAGAFVACAIASEALAHGSRWLEPIDVEKILRAYGIPVLHGVAVDGPEGAANAARDFGGPVALKIRSRDLTHKSDAGGVALGVAGAERVRLEAVAMLARVKAAQPGARVEGFLVQDMAVRPGAIELIVGASVDPVFGPVVLFGHGGTAVEFIGDTSLELPPLNLALARAQIARTRVWRLLQGYRSTPAADLDAIANVVIAVGAIMLGTAAIREIDINPLLADANGVVAVDARIAVAEGPATPPALGG